MLTMAEHSVPRYTSYPTAPHFSAAVGPQSYAAWLAAQSKAATLSLDLHVPYCTELCLYCGCTTKAARRRAPVEAYAVHLAREPGNSRPQRDTPSRRTIAHAGGSSSSSCAISPSISTPRRGPADFSAELEEIDALSASGIVRREGRVVIMTEMGRPFVRLVAAAFDAYLPKHRARHSVAV
jgi:coproporphyrinogen III oxidase-like Fe-S oxidoreductase